MPPANPDVDAVEPVGYGLRRLEGWLDHVGHLGCGGPLLTPIGVSSTHGYDVVDPLRLDQRLGGEHDFDQLVAACQARGLRLLLDGVFNHVGRAFPRFRDVLEHRARSRWASWFRLTFDRDDGDGFGYRCFEGHRELVALNHRDDEVLEWARSVAGHWLDRGADGWRLDAAYAMPPSFLAALVDHVVARHPGAFVFGEVIHGDYVRFVSDSHLHSVTQYELHKALWSSLNDANFFELAWAVDRHRRFTQSFVPVIFAGNHDVTRLASQLRDPRHLALAATALLTLPGLPCIYYGDELAWRGVKKHRAGGDDAIRPPLPPSAAPADHAAREVLEAHRVLIAVRRARPWIAHGRVDVAELTNRRMAYSVSAVEGAPRVHVALDVDLNAPSPPPGCSPLAGGPGWLVAEAG